MYQLTAIMIEIPDVVASGGLGCNDYQKHCPCATSRSRIGRLHEDVLSIFLFQKTATASTPNAYWHKDHPRFVMKYGLKEYGRKSFTADLAKLANLSPS
ncbi:hypothetical protein PCANC_14228 [Puccinia coronata f. sp. avenae]|uniref:Uncharacterized protein n=1 Tax=Puccinia coronata f. sp. avenae TaxID=200324 RepID=A0A2N5ULD0_9BASI|nr:hypothetical protein PCANC_18621 [Puccinia coronata f. sp. avenae]PLW38573.1 hypothetical protein PCASD_10799 [Puccinia coronata f. sp. avenae]PLW39903.1 hypothetical protein PCANC_14228 [Puccinia coronata f. sp. avenae]